MAEQKIAISLNLDRRDLIRQLRDQAHDLLAAAAAIEDRLDAEEGED